MEPMSWMRRLLRRGETTELDPGRGDLVVVAASFDDAEACSAALGRSGNWTADQPVVLRHYLRVPAAQRDAVQVIAAQLGYDTGSSGETASSSEDADALILRRVQILDAVHCSQERSRMTAVAHRHGGEVLGWDALQPGAIQPGEKK